ncbi:MAG TPA: type VI secretion system protein, partial [Anaeromyxobacteraceae bacterium]
MHPFTGIPARVADLARSRGVRAAMGGSAATGLAAGALPLLEIPGWELGEVSALLGVAAGVALGVAAARREPGGDPSPARAAVAAGAAAAAGVGLLFLAAALRAAVTTPCRAAVQADLFFLTALPSALLGAALGAAAATAARGRRLPAALLAAGAALASLALTLWRGYRGPSAALRDHLLGVWPGPVYDEALAADGSLVLFRLGTLAWAAGLAAAAEALARRRAGRPARGAAALAALGAAGALAAGAAGGDLPSRGAVARALGGLAEGRRCAVHHPREKAGGEAERLLRDCEFAAAEVARALELRNPPRARVFVYRSPDEKRRLVGAGRTSFTKPWLAEIHVNDEPSPRPVLRHELVHALASALAPGPLRVPARGLVLVRAGLVEGLAAGLEPPSGPFTQHQWARAMRDLGLLPPPAAFLGEARFLAAAPARAYAAAGSFVRFLLETRGPSAVARLYASGDLEGAVGLDLAAAARAWSGFLDGVESAPGLAAAAELRFREPPLHRRTCGREQALLAARAGEAARR